MRGRVASLLEVGTGFHPELTGRENVYLSGAILGMSWEEIRSRFDEIVDFAEVRKFIDTPVKRYSSGMYLRLAFAVAAHLDPDVLIVDEVLAVGDAAFQQKCLGRMTDFTRQGRTVVFVSHNLGAVQTLCRRALLVQNGRLIADDTAAATVARYLVGLESKAAEDLSHRTDRAGTGQVRLTAIRIASTSASAGSSVLVTGQPARFEFLFAPKLSSPTCSFTIYDQLGQPVTFFDSSVRSQADDIGAEAISRAVCDVGELLLMPGRYRINAAIGSGGEIHDRVEGAMFFEVEEGHIGGRPVTRTSGYGSAVMHHRWTGLFEPAQLTFQTWTESE
jgi:lipopolysaccharide transport system ATP-binding protein